MMMPKKVPQIFHPQTIHLSEENLSVNLPLDVLCEYAHKIMWVAFKKGDN